MQACYVNTTHPDFLGGHRVRCYFVIFCLSCTELFLSVSYQAMSIVNDKMIANKPPPPPEVKGKLAPGQINNNKDLEVEIKKDEPGFFGSFWKPTGAQKKKPGVSSMDAVSNSCDFLDGFNLMDHDRISLHLLFDPKLH